MSVPMINGVQHSWASVKINMLGRTITGVVSINYDDTRNMENLYGAGSMPDHRGAGRYEAVASIELFQYEVVAIQQASLGQRIQNIAPFDIVVTFMPTQNAPAVVDIIRNVQITKNVRALAEGDTMSKVPLELICSHIDWHGQLPGSGGI